MVLKSLRDRLFALQSTHDKLGEIQAELEKLQAQRRAEIGELEKRISALEGQRRDKTILKTALALGGMATPVNTRSNASGQRLRD